MFFKYLFSSIYFNYSEVIDEEKFYDQTHHEAVMCVSSVSGGGSGEVGGGGGWASCLCAMC